MVRKQPHNHGAHAATEQVQTGEEQRHGRGPQARFDDVLDRGIDAGIEVVGEQPADAEHRNEQTHVDPPGEQCVAGRERGDQHAHRGEYQPATGKALMDAVSDPAAQGQPDQTGQADDHTGGDRGVDQRDPVVTHQQRHHEGVACVGGEVERQPGQHQPPEGTNGQDFAHRLLHRLLRDLDGLRRTALRLADQEDEQRQHQPRHRGDEEGRTPAAEELDHGADGEECQQQSQRQAQHEDAHGPCPLVCREQIADQRVGGRRVAGLADADAHTHQQEAPEIPGQPVDRRQAAPGGEPPAHDLAPRTEVGHAPQRQTGNGVDDGEGGADQAELEVVEAPFQTNRLDCSYIPTADQPGLDDDSRVCT